MIMTSSMKMTITDLLSEDLKAEYLKKCLELAEQMFGRDSDGMLPISLELLDTTRNECLHYEQIPHFYRCQTTQEKEERLQLLLQNVRIATEKLDKEIRIKNIAFRHKRDE